ncbi:hypothetical protein SLS62_009760 [Diatrype stigma]|uniref:Uncharacterized protein n=1 Tax=Diatrype stigma TaxID=117547 RepID=A0AAN9ULL9_9PEZI
MTSTEQPQFTNGFSGGATTAGAEAASPQVTSRDHTNTPEWARFEQTINKFHIDASKTPPSRFQKRKGSIYATPSSRDGHVERNREAVEEFHRAHSKRWSVSSTSSSGAKSTSDAGRKSSVSGSHQ